MNQTKFIMMATAITVTALVLFSVSVATGNVQAYTSGDLTAATTQGYNVAKNARISAFAMETCANQMTAGDLSNVDACISITKTFDKYMSLAVAEANGDIQKVTGYGSVS